MSFFGSLFGTDDAAKAIKKSQQANIEQAQETQQQNNALYAPYVGQGTAANTTIGNLLGFNGAGNQQTAIGNYQMSPDYQVRYNQGIDALDRSALSKYGSLNNGNVLKAITNYGQDQGQLAFGDYYNRLLGQQGVGLQGAQGTANSNLSASGQIQNANTAIGQGEANASLAQGSLLMGGLSTLAGLAGYGMGPGFLRPTAQSNLATQQQYLAPPMLANSGYGFFRQ